MILNVDVNVSLISQVVVSFDIRSISPTDWQWTTLTSTNDATVKSTFACKNKVSTKGSKNDYTFTVISRL